MQSEQMEKTLQEFVKRITAGADENIRSVILYGSAASGEFVPDFSDINLLCLLRELSASAMLKLGPTVRWWTGQKHPTPLLLTAEDLERSADVFAIELLDIQQHHRVLYGDDPIAKLDIPRNLHRVQLEHELRTKLILLRQRFVAVSSQKDKVLALMLDSVSSFLTLFRHSLIAMGEQPPAAKHAALQQLERKIGIDTKAFLDLLGVRERKVKARSVDPHGIFSSYVKAIESVISAVDRL